MRLLIGAKVHWRPTERRKCEVFEGFTQQQEARSARRRKAVDQELADLAKRLPYELDISMMH